MIFKQQFNKVIGLKSFTNSGTATLGIKVICHILILSKSIVPSWKSKQSSYISDLIMCQSWYQSKAWLNIEDALDAFDTLTVWLRKFKFHLSMFSSIHDKVSESLFWSNEMSLCTHANANSGRNLSKQNSR
jgi:hypothetical protein